MPRSTIRISITRLKLLPRLLLDCLVVRSTIRISITRLKLQNSPPKVLIEDNAISNIPSQFKKETVKVDVMRKELLEHIQTTGEISDGVEVVQDDHLRIK